MTMTKKEAIKYRLEHMDDEDLICLINDICSYNGEYDTCVFYRMDEFNDVMDGYTPMEIVEEVTDHCGDFKVTDDYFYYDCGGVLCSCDEATAADLIRTNYMDSLVDDFMHGRNDDFVEDYDAVLSNVITADNDTIFDDEGHEILE